MRKAVIGVFSLTCCEGCSISILELEEQMLKLLDFVEIADFRILKKKRSHKQLDIAFVDGAVVGEDDEQTLREIRGRSSKLVAIGACAVTGGIPAIRNNLPFYAQKQMRVLAQKAMQEKVCAVDEIVKVDHYIRGCPIVRHDLLDAVLRILHGVNVRDEDVPVCFECKQKNNACLLLQGKPCLGPVTYAGCNAVCPTERVKCIGCRGFTKDANFDSLRELFRKQGANETDINNLFEYFNRNPFGKEPHAQH